MPDTFAHRPTVPAWHAAPRPCCQCSVLGPWARRVGHGPRRGGVTRAGAGPQRGAGLAAYLTGVSRAGAESLRGGVLVCVEGMAGFVLSDVQAPRCPPEPISG